MAKSDRPRLRTQLQLCNALSSNQQLSRSAPTYVGSEDGCNVELIKAAVAALTSARRLEIVVVKEVLEIDSVGACALRSRSDLTIWTSCETKDESKTAVAVAFVVTGLDRFLILRIFITTFGSGTHVALSELGTQPSTQE